MLESKLIKCNKSKSLQIRNDLDAKCTACINSKNLQRGYKSIHPNDITGLTIDDVAIIIEIRTGSFDIKITQSFKYSDTICRMCNQHEENIKHVFECSTFNNENYDILTKWDIINIGYLDFFTCGDVKAWRRRALKGKLVQRALRNMVVNQHIYVDLSDEAMESLLEEERTQSHTLLEEDGAESEANQNPNTKL